jgi:hypothetical protein
MLGIGAIVISGGIAIAATVIDKSRAVPPGPLRSPTAAATATVAPPTSTSTAIRTPSVTRSATPRVTPTASPTPSASPTPTRVPPMRIVSFQADANPSCSPLITWDVSGDPNGTVTLIRVETGLITPPPPVTLAKSGPGEQQYDDSLGTGDYQYQLRATNSAGTVSRTIAVTCPVS